MKYNFDELDTFQKVFNKGLELAKTDKEEAKIFFKEYCELIVKENPELSKLEAVERAKRNFGYWAGYYSNDIIDLIYNTFQTEHPYLGKKPYELSSEEAFNIGKQLGEGTLNI